MGSSRIATHALVLVAVLGACNDAATTGPAERPAADKLVTEYELVDLGTAGGVHAQATGINIHGTIVGWSEDAAGRRRPFRAQVGKSGGVSLEFLPMPGPAQCSSARVDVINDQGLMAGFSDPNAGCGDVVSIVWDRNRTLHHTFENGCNAPGDSFVDLNNRGVAVVSFQDTDMAEWDACFGRVGERATSVYADNGTYTLRALNDHGIAVGSATLPSSGRRPVALDLRCADRPACQRPLPVPPGAAGEAVDINDRGQIIGNLLLANGDRRTVEWDLDYDGQFNDKGTSCTHQVNNGRVAAGASDCSSSAQAIALHLASGRRILLPVPPGSTGSAATAVNDRNELVGWYYDYSYDGVTPTKRAALWRPIK